MNLTNEERERYKRQLALGDFSETDQLKLKASKVAVIGAGGLGSPIILYLVAAGVGEVRIIDYDTITLSNMQRQIIYCESDLGEGKALIASRRGALQNPCVSVIPYNEKLSEANSHLLLSDSQLIIDATDNRQTRFCLDETAYKLGIPYLYGAVEGYKGQMALFYTDGNTTRYGDIFPPHCVENDAREVAILGSVAGTVGAVMATEAIKHLLGKPSAIASRLLLYNANTQTIETLSFPS